jgi:YggT family protein
VSMLITIVYSFVQVLIFAIFARSLLSWFPIDKNGPVFQFLDAVTDPILMPLRKIVPNIGMLDITPMVAIFVLFAISRALESAA